jgi:hypothetical protein
MIYKKLLYGIIRETIVGYHDWEILKVLYSQKNLTKAALLLTEGNTQND